MKVLVTGGAGFVGSHLGKELLKRGHSVRALDSLVPQVHGEGKKRPVYLDEKIELQIGDVRNVADVEHALEGVDAVVHLAAAVGVGQSMYEVAEYVSTNNLGTAILVEALSKKPVKKLVVASSMSVYGEGLYETEHGEKVADAERSLEQLKAHQWEAMRDGKTLRPVPTPEEKQPTLASVYALSKYDQERMCLMIGKAYGIPAVALRLFNIYGPYQSLSNPYTGVLAIFASRLLNGHAPIVYEDGNQRRDLVSVYDIARAFCLALEKDVDGEVINIGSGVSSSVAEVARALSRALGKSIEPEVSGKYRVGDIRNCFSDISKAKQLLGYEPQVKFEDGLKDLVEWLKTATAEDKAAKANDELAKRGLAL